RVYRTPFPTRRSSDLGLLMRHETFPAVLFDCIRHRIQAQVIGGCTFHRGVLEAADAIQLRFAQPVEQILEVFFGLAGETNNEGRSEEHTSELQSRENL